MRIAYFSPLPPCRSGVGDYSQELLPHLANWATIDLFRDDSHLDGCPLGEQFPVYHKKDFERLYPRYHACLYHLGNDLSHEYILETMLQRPSFAILHDVSLHPLISPLTIGRGNRGAYMREIGYAYGQQGIAEARAALSRNEFPFSDRPLCRRIVDLNLGTIVHSEFAAGMIRAVRPEANLAVIPMGMSMVKVASQEESRERLRLAKGEFMIASLGFATPSKRLEPALKAFARFLVTNPHSRFLVVGEVPPWYDLKQIVEDLHLGGRVLLTGRVPIEDFYAYASAADVCLNLRYPTSGETSGSVLRIMAVGRPVVVSQVGSFNELPQETCVHVPTGDGEVESIIQALERLAGNGTLRRRVGQAAQAYVQENHSWSRSAELYYQFVKGTLAGL
ncbi:MAG: glycosyltransferase family 4 protein [Dehalococcoidia bacterium]|nr:glycosyltransferase family 4 protein [Dehalococcoidia bacterium]